MKRDVEILEGQIRKLEESLRAKEQEIEGQMGEIVELRVRERQKSDQVEELEKLFTL